MKRRSFLKALLGGLGAAALPAGLLRSRPERKLLLAGSVATPPGGWHHIMCFWSVEREADAKWYINGIEYEQYNRMTLDERRRIYEIAGDPVGDCQEVAMSPYRWEAEDWPGDTISMYAHSGSGRYPIKHILAEQAPSSDITPDDDFVIEAVFTETKKPIDIKKPPRSKKGWTFSPG